MIKFLSSSLLVLGLITAAPALAQETRGFDFDFDQQSDGTLVTQPSETSREPITAPVRSSDKTAPAQAQDASIAPLPPNAAAPATAETQAASTVPKDKDGVIVVIGEPDPPAAQDQPLSEDELYNLFAAPEPKEVKLTPEGLPPTTSVPAGPGEARVEKAGPTQSAAAKAPKKSDQAAAKSAPAKTAAPAAAKAGSKSPEAAPAKSAKPAAPARQSAAKDTLVKRGDIYYHQWYLAQKAWSRVGAAASPRTASLARGRLLYPIDRAGLPKMTPARTSRVYADQYSTWQTTPVVEITRFP